MTATDPVMKFYVALLGLLLAVAELHAKELSPGPEAIKDSTSSSSKTPEQNTQKRYVTKEIILYLTPSQIEALKSGKGLVSPQTVPQLAEQEVQKDQLSFQEHDELIRQQFENIKVARIASRERQQIENVELNSQIPTYHNDEVSNENQQKNLEFINFWNQNQPNLEYFYPRSQESKQIEQLQTENEKESEKLINSWSPYNYAPEKRVENESTLNEKLGQQWNRLVDQNAIQLKALSAISLPTENSEEQITQTEKPLLQLQYAPRYNDQKNAIEIEKLVRLNHRQELAKQSALAKAEAIANSPPILIHQEVKITKHRPVPIVKHVKVQVPTPVLVPVPEPYEVKVPQPYPVPLEIIKHIPVPVIKTEKVEVEKPIPYEVEKRVPVPVTKKVYVNVDRPYFVHKIVPLEIKKEVPVEIPVHRPEKLTILRHVWQN